MPGCCKALPTHKVAMDVAVQVDAFAYLFERPLVPPVRRSAMFWVARRPAGKARRGSIVNPM